MTLPSMQVWDVSGVAAAAEEGASSGKPAQLQSTAVVAAHDKDINALAVSPNDALICTASQDRTAKASTCCAPAATLLEACLVAVVYISCRLGVYLFLSTMLQQHRHHLVSFSGHIKLEMVCILPQDRTPEWQHSVMLRMGLGEAGVAVA